jgi:hypothetical protein
VVAAQRYDPGARLEHVLEAILDVRDRVVDAERVDREIAGVSDLKCFEWRNIKSRIVRSEKARSRSDGFGTEASARAITGPGVKGHSENSNIAAINILPSRQSCKRGEPANRGIVVASTGPTFPSLSLASMVTPFSP